MPEKMPELCTFSETGVPELLLSILQIFRQARVRHAYFGSFRH